MARLEGRIAIVTGAGRGLGREHALFLARNGAKVVVNDLGGDIYGAGADGTPAQKVAAEIEELGGQAVVSGHDVADWDQAGALVQTAVDAFGGFDILVNNAGILRDRTLANMAEDEWDAVIRVHLKGHAATAHHALAYWRDRAKAGDAAKAAMIHTASSSGYLGNYGQANYGAAKMGIVTLSKVCAIEGARFGVRSNVIGPAAATRMAATVPGTPLGSPDDVPPLMDPANVSPLVGWLAAEDCPATGQVFHVYGNRIIVVRVSQIAADVRTEGRWTLEQLDAELPGNLVEHEDPLAWFPTEEDATVPFGA